MSKKDYRQGMSDAMAAYEAFGEKQEAAIQHVGAEIEKTAGKVDKLGGKIGEIADYITNQEKAALYKLNTPVDIADLDDAEKRILVAVLYQLSADEDEVTEEQQNYVRAVQQYLKIYNPQTEINLEAVENIEDISTQKAVLQATLEFFRLGTHPEELTEEQEDFLDCFQVNRKTRREINGYIDAIVEAVGLQGLSEKYGFVANQPRSEFATYKDNGPIPEKVADICISQLGKHWIREIPYNSGRRFLETQDYLVYYQGKHDGDSSPEGFYRIGKRTGDIERIPFDIPSKSFWFENLTFHVYKNTIYFIERTIFYLDPQINNLFVLDLDSQICKKLPFKAPCDLSIRFHLSGNENYLMIHCIYMDSIEKKTVKLDFSKTYIIDLAHGERTFLLKPPMEGIIDAFVWDGKFLFSGTISKKDYRISLYQYDVTSKSLAEMFNPAGNAQAFYSTLGKILSDVNCFGVNSADFRMVKEIYYVNSNYYFLVCKPSNDNRAIMVDCLYRLPKNIQELNYTNMILGCSPSFHNDSALFFLHYVNEGLSAHRYDFTTLDSECIDQDNHEIKYYDDVSYFLLGDYLYKHIKASCEWYRTNISSDWKNLQWEIISGFGKLIS